MLHADAIQSKIKQAFHCVSWNPFPVDFWTGKKFEPGVVFMQFLRKCKGLVRTHNEAKHWQEILI